MLTIKELLPKMKKYQPKSNKHKVSAKIFLTRIVSSNEIFSRIVSTKMVSIKKYELKM